MCEFLGWRAPVAPVVLALQLIQYAKMHGQEVAVNPLEQPIADNPVPDDVRETVMRIYGMLESHIETPEFASVKSQLRGHSCVLIGDAFVSCDRVALTCAVDAGPLLYALPEELASLQQLFVQLGVRDKFSGGDFVGALKRLADANRGSTLETQQIAWASVLAREAAQYQMSAAEKEGMWLPDAAGEMTPARCLVYDDAPWLSSTLNDVRFVHKEVAGQVAEVLGLRSVRKHRPPSASDTKHHGHSATLRDSGKHSYSNESGVQRNIFNAKSVASELCGISRQALTASDHHRPCWGESI